MLSRRLFASVVLSTTIAVLLFALPLGYAVWSRELDHARLRLERAAVLAASGLQSDEQEAQTGVLPNVTDIQFALYDASGQRLAGQGPATGDVPVRAAIQNRLVDRHSSDRLVVAVPVTKGPPNAVVLRAETDLQVVIRDAAQQWAALAALAIIAVGLAAIVARRQARRLASPVEELGNAAQRLGDGDFTVSVPTTGIRELDATGAALSATANRLGNLLDRERSFTADASHQLRTPLTGMRLLVESELAAPRADHTEVLKETLTQIIRLDQITTQLLQLARDTPADRGPLDIGAVADDIQRRWEPRLQNQDRQFVVERAAVEHPPFASRSAIQHAIDVLMDNALHHGAGTTTLAFDAVEGGLSITVSDEGPGVPPPVELVFARRASGTGTGIGLALARSLIEAENGRLELLHSGPHPQFRILLMTPAGVTNGRTGRAGR